MGIKQAIERSFPHPELGPRPPSSTLSSQIPAAAFEIKGLAIAGGMVSKKKWDPCRDRNTAVAAGAKRV
tara:strand:- start:210 stop:416 length:207 start_codon:yes stop_codon:yes gene_type:complete